jgi:hypothetical protein
MSHFAAIKLQFKDESILLNTLKLLGLSPVIHKTPVLLESRWGNSEYSAHIVLPKAQLNIGADVGFLREDDGAFSLIADDWELGRNSNFRQNLSAEYTAQSAIKLGFKVKSREKLPDGRLQIKLKPPVNKLQQNQIKQG